MTTPGLREEGKSNEKDCGWCGQRIRFCECSKEKLNEGVWSLRRDSSKLKENLSNKDSEIAKLQEAVKVAEEALEYLKNHGDRLALNEEYQTSIDSSFVEAHRLACEALASIKKIRGEG